MSQTTRLALNILIAAIVFGLLTNLLILRGSLWGLNAFVCVVLFTAGLLWLARRQGKPLAPAMAAFCALACLFAAFIALRDSPTLTFLNTLAIGMIFALCALRGRQGSLLCASVLEYPLGIVRVGFNAAFGGFPLLLRETGWKEIPKGQWQQKAFLLLRGVLIAIPLLLLFGSLFMSADPIFNHYISRLFDWDSLDFATNALWGLFWGWGAAGMLRALLIREWKPVDSSTPPRAALSITEVGTALALLNILFLAFVIVQFGFFFGGAGYVHRTIGMTYTDYARGGFFELTWVSFLVLPLLLVAHALLLRGNPRDQRIFAGLSSFLVLLLFVIMASAIQRMRLYVLWGGLTELRLYTSAFMGWLAMVFVWFLATVLRGRRELFAFGALVAGFAVLAFLDGLNPDAFIVRTNLMRPSATKLFDVDYNAQLSADTAPVLVAGLPRLSADKQGLTAYYILSQWTPPAKQDWREWNLGRMRAWQAVRRDQPHLKAIAKAPTPPKEDPDAY